MSHVHERVGQRSAGFDIVGHGQFVFGDEPRVPKPAEDRADADHPEPGHFDRTKGAHARRAQDDRPGSKSREDLQRRNRQALEELAIDDAHDGRVLSQRGSQVATADWRTVARLRQHGPCSRNGQAWPQEYERAVHARYRLPRAPRGMRSGSKCLAAQCSRPGTMTFTTGRPTSGLVRSTAITCFSPADSRRRAMK